MFDTMDAFTRQFTPVDGGYLYYPSKNDGGKLVTAEEFESLVADWQRVAGRSGRWKAVGLVALGLLLWAFISQAVVLPNWADSIITLIVVLGLSARIFWASLAPRRLVRGRPAISPPRPLKQVGREARAALSWPVIVFALLISGAIFVGHLASPEDSLRWWALTLGSGLILGVYLWGTMQKFRDR